MLGVLIGVLSVALLAAHMALAHAQAQVSLAAPPATQGTGLGDLLADPGKWATTMFNAALIGLDEKTTSDVVGFMGRLLGNGNLISQTPPGLYDSDAVARLWGTMRAVANGGLGVVTVWGGVNMMKRANRTSALFVRATLGHLPRDAILPCGGSSGADVDDTRWLKQGLRCGHAIWLACQRLVHNSTTQCQVARQRDLAALRETAVAPAAVRRQRSDLR
jgi:hypothetical protein